MMSTHALFDGLSTSEVSDALDSLGVEGALLGLKPLSKSCRMVGPAFTITYAPYDKAPSTFQTAANYIDDVPAGSVIVIDNQGKEEMTVWGGILTHTALQKKIAGTLVYGAARDLAVIQSTHYPILAKGVTMRSGKNRVRMVAKQKPVHIQGIQIEPGSMVFSDLNGAVVIPKHLLKEVLNRAKQIKVNEDKILKSIQEGTSLEASRKRHHYAMPWKRD